MGNCLDCKFVGTKNSNGQVWCEKKKIYVNIDSQSSCNDFEKK